MTTTRRSTKATRGKLERALEQLESFRDSDDFDSVLSSNERTDLRHAIRTIQTIEGRLYNGGQS